MIDLLTLHKRFILEHLRPGDTCADFTMGNGYDTVFLSGAVGEGGRVYAFDIQEQALRETGKRLAEAGCPRNYELILDSHANADRYIHGKIKAGMFNLGWLPGSDRSVTTKKESTLEAVEKAIGMLDTDGVITVAVYPGHREGDEEGRLLEEYFAALSRFEICATKIRILNSEKAPYFYLVESK
ncbi:MAG: class I SAM-dependent methyltransferase [Clostridia bacterium]|nr:class I SAM-dependent methyltransferase [Clostridia bacterium]